MVADLEPRTNTAQASEIGGAFYARLDYPEGPRIACARIAGNLADGGPIQLAPTGGEVVTLAPGTDGWHAARLALSGIDLLAEYVPAIVQSTGEDAT